MWGLPTFDRNKGLAYASPVYSFGMRSPFGSSVSFRHPSSQTKVYFGSYSFTMGSPFLGSSSRIHTYLIGSKELLVAGCCALVLLVVLIFDSGLSSPSLISCFAMSLR